MTFQHLEGEGKGNIHNTELSFNFTEDTKLNLQNIWKTLSLSKLLSKQLEKKKREREKTQINRVQCNKEMSWPDSFLYYKANSHCISPSLSLSLSLLRELCHWLLHLHLHFHFHRLLPSRKLKQKGEGGEVKNFPPTQLQNIFFDTQNYVFRWRHPETKPVLNFTLKVLRKYPQQTHKHTNTHIYTHLYTFIKKILNKKY